MRLDALTLKQLRALTAIARTGSLTAAANELGLTPPAIHSQIRNLETALGVEVMTRDPDGGGMRLTPQGNVVLRAAERMSALLSHAGADLKAMAQGKHGHVTLGVVSTARYFAPGLVKILADRCPEIELTLRVGNRESVIADIDRATVDLAIMGRPPRVPEVNAVPLGPHPHGIVLRPDHPLAAAAEFDPEILMAETFLSREEGSGTRILMNRFIDGIWEGALPRIIEMDSNETIKQAAMAGLGIAMLSLHTIEPELSTGRLVLLRGQGLPIMRHWYLVHAAATPPGGSAARVAAEIAALNGTFLPRLPTIA